MIIKETKYLIFDIVKEKPKTKVVSVINKSSQREIGIIEWYSNWRQYCFMPNYGTVWNNDCLNSINQVIGQLMQER